MDVLPVELRTISPVVNSGPAVVVATPVPDVLSPVSELSEQPVMDTPIMRKILSARKIFAECSMHNDYSAVY